MDSNIPPAQACRASAPSADPLYRIAELDPPWLQTHVPVGQLDGPSAGNHVFLALSLLGIGTE